MPRTEFNTETRRDALKRAKGSCEGLLSTGHRCAYPLSRGKYAFDHVIADQLGGKADLSNCQVLCTACHLEKTRRDAALIAKAKRRADAHHGTDAPRQRIASPGFRQAPKRRPATTPVEKLTIAYRRPNA